MVIYNHSKGKVDNKMKMNLVKELHKEIDGDNYGMKLYQVGQYEVEVFHTDYASGAVEDDIRVSTVDGCSRYVPKIYYNSEFFGSKAKVFTIQTVSYGDLKPEDFRAYLAAQNEALEVVETLKEELL